VEPSERFKVILTADYAVQSGLGQQQSSSGLIDLTTPVRFPSGYWTSANPSNGFRNFKNGNYYADITADLGFAQLYVQPTYNRSRYVLESNTFSLLTYQTRLSQALASTTPILPASPPRWPPPMARKSRVRTRPRSKCACPRVRAPGSSGCWAAIT
jgi:hypothetical protein